MPTHNPFVIVLGVCLVLLFFGLTLAAAWAVSASLRLLASKRRGSRRDRGGPVAALLPAE